MLLWSDIITIPPHILTTLADGMPVILIGYEAKGGDGYSE